MLARRKQKNRTNFGLNTFDRKPRGISGPYRPRQSIEGFHKATDIKVIVVQPQNVLRFKRHHRIPPNERPDTACRDDRGAPQSASGVHCDRRILARRLDFALLALPGASAYFLGGAVAYTRPSKIMLLGLDKAALAQFRPATEGHALLLVRGAQARFAANWGLGETGATGLTSNRYGDPVGHTCLAVAGPVERSRPAAPSGSTTCTPLPPPALSFWPKQSPSIGHAKRFLPPVSQPAVLL